MRAGRAVGDVLVGLSSAPPCGDECRVRGPAPGSRRCSSGYRRAQRRSGVGVQSQMHQRALPCRLRQRRNRAAETLVPVGPQGPRACRAARHWWWSQRGRAGPSYGLLGRTAPAPASAAPATNRQLARTAPHRANLPRRNSLAGWRRCAISRAGSGAADAGGRGETWFRSNDGHKAREGVLAPARPAAPSPLSNRASRGLRRTIRTRAR